MLSLLVFSTLFPNARRPNHGVFVENRLRHLVQSGEAEASVVAPVPWYWRAPGRETWHGLPVWHPRWPALPRIGMTLAPDLLYAGARPTVHGLIRGGARFDAIDAHYFYPDGVAAIRLGEAFGLPVVITARGSDVTQFPDFPAPRRRILAAAARAAALVTVSAGLRDALVRLGVPEGRITVLRNGVDLTLFRPLEREAARARLGLDGPTLVSVGALIPRKGHDRTIGALRLLPGWRLLIAGEGPERARLMAQARDIGVGGRVRFLGAWPHAELAALYSAAEMSVLASSREGWANVLLESMACGTPVVAAPIPGNDEVIAAPAAGIIASANTPEGLASAVRQLCARGTSRAATRAYAEGFSWDATTQGQLSLFRRVAGCGPAGR
jgi:glycosyltransferase involved in cell wall biosynthesis